MKYDISFFYLELHCVFDFVLTLFELRPAMCKIFMCYRIKAFYFRKKERGEKEREKEIEIECRKIAELRRTISDQLMLLRSREEVN